MIHQKGNAMTRRRIADMWLLAVTLVIAGQSPLLAQEVWNQTRKLVASDGWTNDTFGHSVAADGRFVVVGANQADANGSDSGCAYVFDVQTGAQLLRLFASDGANGDRFGESVGISGNRIIVGSPYADATHFNSGAAYIFDADSGQQLHKLVAADGEAQDGFGYSVAISGSLAIVGAPWDDDNGEDSGSAYLFNVETGGQLAKLDAGELSDLDEFGRAVAIDGGYALCGAWKYDDRQFTRAGAAYLFDTTTGSLLHKLVAFDSDWEDYFGCSVSIHGNTAVVGAVGADESYIDAGAAYVFHAPSGEFQHKLVASDRQSSDQLGHSISVAGERIAVGAPNDNDGRGSVYVFDAVTGAEIQRVFAVDSAVDDDFGFSTAMKDSRLVVGARRADTVRDNAGAGYLFSSTGSMARLFIAPLPLVGRQSATFTVEDARPNERTWLLYSLAGLGTTYIPALNVVVDLARPQLGAGPRLTNENGRVEWTARMPSVSRAIPIWFQGVQRENTTNVVATELVP
ncbi:MAG: FG-GAP repeat protein [Phycisphaerales bacterium]|nr:FG-GAP repeat protein [Phycisphaerales bacterium]